MFLVLFFIENLPYLQVKKKTQEKKTQVQSWLVFPQNGAIIRFFFIFYSWKWVKTCSPAGEKHRINLEWPSNYYMKLFLLKWLHLACLWRLLFSFPLCPLLPGDAMPVWQNANNAYIIIGFTYWIKFPWILNMSRGFMHLKRHRSGAGTPDTILDSVLPFEFKWVEVGFFPPFYVVFCLITSPLLHYYYFYLNPSPYMYISSAQSPLHPYM